MKNLIFYINQHNSSALQCGSTNYIYTAEHEYSFYSASKKSALWTLKCESITKYGTLTEVLHKHCQSVAQILAEVWTRIRKYTDRADGTAVPGIDLKLKSWASIALSGPVPQCARFGITTALAV